MPVTPLQPGSNPLLFIGDQIADFVGGQPTVGPLVTDASNVVQVYEGSAPEVSADRIILSFVSGPEGETRSLDAIGLTESRWEFQCWSATKANARRIANALVNDVLDFSGVLVANGATVDISEVLDARGPDFDYSVKQYRCDVDLLIKF
jgi:hypothetical protein